jgi:hypothetical protein
MKSHQAGEKIRREVGDQLSAVPHDGVRAYRIREAFERIGIKSTNGFALIKDGELETFTIGRFRYVTEAELRRFIQKRIEESMRESAADRARKVKGAVEGRARQRELAA